ncbi:MAG: putative cobaltochelatase [Dehalococcoides mccartyi]|uniref:putative cobaltochelatase n=1 Tax=Dehalococcoides mccartyi TaxID=61435 RepID=UPI0030F8D6CC
MQKQRPVYPFSAIVGQDKMKQALILNAINPGIGGVLLRGEKGTAKSLAVRALSGLLPDIDAVDGCAYGCNPYNPMEQCDYCLDKLQSEHDTRIIKKRVPVIELPIGSTEDRVIGTLNIEKAIKTGQRQFEPGLLASANRGILYIDEVNLLDDHLVDILLDAAAMGRNYIEREGISFSHPASFILIGTMNPEEGDIRPQLLDRFGLSVEVSGMSDKNQRAEVICRRIRFEKDPEDFNLQWAEEQQKLRQCVVNARQTLPGVSVSRSILDLITQICIDFNVDGHRADIVVYKTAQTLAAYHGRLVVSKEDVVEAAELALSHRRRRQPFDDPGLDKNKLEDSVRQWQEESNQPPPPDSPPQEPDTNDSSRAENLPESPSDSRETSQPEKEENPLSPPSPPQPQSSQDKQDNHPGKKEQVFDASFIAKVRNLAARPSQDFPRMNQGRRTPSASLSHSGHYVGCTIPQGKVTDLSFDGTLRAAAPYQLERREEQPGGGVLLLEKQDLREKKREIKTSNLIIFALDGSGSMAAEERMRAAKGAVASLLIDAYQKRDKVGMVVFRGEKAELVLPPTNNASLANQYLQNVPTGGRTPLAEGLKRSLEVISEQQKLDKTVVPLLVLISDGRANYGQSDPVAEAEYYARQISEKHISSIAIDTERDFISLGLVKKIAESMGSVYLKLEQITSDPITRIVSASLRQNSERR